MAEFMRLDRLVASQVAELSRSMIKDMCRKGLITVNGTAVKKSDTKVDLDKDIVVCNGAEITYRKYIYIMMNKPQGVVCSTKDGESRTVIDICPEEFLREGLFPAGRLDKDTEGFVLLTDDGELAHKMLSPKTHVPKKYYVELESHWENFYAEEFEKGMEIDGGEKCLPAEFLGNNENLFACEVILHEGKFHQVKRMFAKLGNSVVYLKRVSIGGIQLDEKLPLGECLEIMHKDVDKLLLR